MSDTDDAGGNIPTSGGRSRAVCDDCGHNGHFLDDCKQCGCPSGKQRKAERDSAVAGSKGDATRPAQGFF